MSVAANQADVDIDLGRLASAVWRRRAAILLVTFAAAAAAFLLAMTMDSLYKAETRILIAPREPVYLNNAGADATFDERTVASQVEILKSADLIKTVARRLDLASRTEFDPAGEPSLPETLLIALGLADNPLDQPAGERVLKSFYEKLTVYVVPNSRIVAIEFSARDPQLAANVANALADAYLEFNAGLKIENNSDASAWLEPEIEELSANVREAEEKVAQYRAEKGLLLVGERETIADRQLADISAELSRVRAERADAEARARTVRAALENGENLGTIGDVLNSANVQRLRERESALRAQIADLSVTLLDGHPRMKALKAQLQALEEQIVAETRKTLESLENNAELAALREEELVGRLNALKANSAQEGEEAVRLRELEREAAAQRQLLETYLARYRESASRSEPASAAADARVISRAVPAAEPYFPKTGPIIIVAALAAFLLSAVWVMLSELLSGRALKPAEGALEAQEADPAVPVAATVATPSADERNEPATREEAVAPEEPEAIEPPPLPLAPTAAAERSDFSVEAVAEQLLGERTRLAISVSPEGDRGSLNTVMLARTVAAEGARVLLVDLTGSGCPTELMAESRHMAGLTDLLCGEVAIADAIHADRLSEAQIVPQGNANMRRAMRAVDRLPMIFDVFVEAYDLVLVECGATDAESVARIARSGEVEIILSLVRPDGDELEATLTDFFAEGFEDVLLMNPGEDPDGPGTRRSAVA